MDVTCRCGKRRYLVWSRNRSILSPLPVSSISIFASNTLSTLCSTSRSASLSRLFQHRPAVAFTRLLHRIMHSVAFPFVSTSIVPRLPFLLSTRFPFFHLFDARFVRHLPQCAHFFVFPQPLSHFLSVYFLFPDWIPILLLQYRALLPTSNCDDLDMTLSFDVVRCYNVLYCSTIL